jgi:hypothetical protein
MTWQPYREPLRSTVLRTGLIAVAGGAVLSQWWGGLARWPVATLFMLFPAFGAHWLEVWFLNWLRPRISAARGVQATARLVVWFVGGAVLALGMAATGLGWRLSWWFGGLGFIGIELAAHLFLQLRGRPSLYNGRG